MTYKTVFLSEEEKKHALDAAEILIKELKKCDLLSPEWDEIRKHHQYILYRLVYGHVIREHD